MILQPFLHVEISLVSVAEQRCVSVVRIPEFDDRKVIWKLLHNISRLSPDASVNFLSIIELLRLKVMELRTFV